MIYNQIVTWTAFAILAMFFKNAGEIKRPTGRDLLLGCHLGGSYFGTFPGRGVCQQHHQQIPSVSLLKGSSNPQETTRAGGRSGGGKDEQ